MFSFVALATCFVLIQAEGKDRSRGLGLCFAIGWSSRCGFGISGLERVGAGNRSLTEPNDLVVLATEAALLAKSAWRCTGRLFERSVEATKRIESGGQGNVDNLFVAGD